MFHCFKNMSMDGIFFDGHFLCLYNSYGGGG